MQNQYKYHKTAHLGGQEELTASQGSMSRIFRHASVSCAHPRAYNCPDPHITALIRDTFKLLESRSCYAAYFLSLLESKREDYLIFSESVFSESVFSESVFSKNIFSQSVFSKSLFFLRISF